MKKEILSTIVYFIIIVVLLYIINLGYTKFEFADYLKASYKSSVKTHFYRDEDVKCSEQNSYCIYSENYNDAFFYKSVKVKKNTPYKVSCMVKTEDVITEKNPSIAGANISIVESVEKSESIVGTNNWQKIELMFNSNEREEVKIAFRLGGYIEDDNVKGKAWFSDIKLEEGGLQEDNNWNFVCFIFTDIDVDVEGENVKLSMSDDDIKTIDDNMTRFKNSIPEMTEGKMYVDYDMFIINEPIKTISYDDEHGYYIDPIDVQDLIKDYIKDNEYDYIFSAVRLGDVNQNIEIPVNDWIGLRWNGLFRNRIF